VTARASLEKALKEIKFPKNTFNLYYTV
jgi:hypothetical protein